MQSRSGPVVEEGADEPINRALRDSGVDIDISKIKPANLEDLVTHLRELALDVDGVHGEKVRVFCECPPSSGAETHPTPARGGRPACPP